MNNVPHWHLVLGCGHSSRVGVRVLASILAYVRAFLSLLACLSNRFTRSCKTLMCRFLACLSNCCTRFRKAFMCGFTFWRIHIRRVVLEITLPLCGGLRVLFMASPFVRVRRQVSHSGFIAVSLTAQVSDSANAAKTHVPDLYDSPRKTRP